MAVRYAQANIGICDTALMANEARTVTNARVRIATAPQWKGVERAVVATADRGPSRTNRAFHLNHANTVLDGLRVTNGHAAARAAAIRLASACEGLLREPERYFGVALDWRG